MNSLRPSLSSGLHVNYTTPLDESKLWSLTLGGSAGYSVPTSYQTKSTLPALDKDSFDYSAFMADFWGNSDGDRFYGGLSGFSESHTRSLSPSAEFSVKYNPERWSFIAGASTSGRIARYSLNPQANLSTLDTRLSASGVEYGVLNFPWSSGDAFRGAGRHGGI